MGIPNMPEPLDSAVFNVRSSLQSLIGELQTYAASYQGEEFRFGCGVLLLLPIRRVFALFLDENNFGEENAIVVKMVIFGGKFWGFRMTKRISGLISFGFIFFYTVLFFVFTFRHTSQR